MHGTHSSVVLSFARCSDVFHVFVLPIVARRERSDRTLSDRSPTRVRFGEGTPVGRVPKVRALESHSARRTLGSNRGVRARFLFNTVANINGERWSCSVGRRPRARESWKAP